MKIITKYIQVQGFTLIELLVVISIISLLSSVLLTSMSEARAKARDAARVQQLGQIRTSLELFYNDFGCYPAFGSPGICHVTSFNNQDYVPITLIASVNGNPGTEILGRPLNYQYRGGNEFVNEVSLDVKPDNFISACAYNDTMGVGVRECSCYNIEPSVGVSPCY